MASEGLSWTWELDFETLLAALQEPPPWSSRGRSTVNSPSDPAAEAGPVEVDPVGPIRLRLIRLRLSSRRS